MKVKKYSHITIILFVIIVGSLSCKRDDLSIKSDIEINKISITGIGDFEYRDSLLIAAENSSTYEICIKTNPPTANIYYSCTNDNFILQKGSEIQINSNYHHLYFYSELKGYNKTIVKQVYFGFNNDNLINDVRYYPNPFVSHLYVEIDIEKNVVGKIKYSISNIAGQMERSYEDLVLGGLYKKKIDLSDLEDGIYFITFKLGDSVISKKIIRR